MSPIFLNISLKYAYIYEYIDRQNDKANGAKYKQLVNLNTRYMGVPWIILVIFPV